MRGIMIHSLMARGVGFEEAYRAANALRDRLAPGAVVQKEDLRKGLRELLGNEPFLEEHRLTLPAEYEVVSGDGKGRPFSKGILSQSLLAAQLKQVENSLWAALRALEENRKLTVRLLADLRARNSPVSHRYEDRLRDIEINATRIRALLMNPIRDDGAMLEAPQ